VSVSLEYMKKLITLVIVIAAMAVTTSEASNIIVKCKAVGSVGKASAFVKCNAGETATECCYWASQFVICETKTPKKD